MRPEEALDLRKEMSKSSTAISVKPRDGSLGRHYSTTKAAAIANFTWPLVACIVSSLP